MDIVERKIAESYLFSLKDLTSGSRTLIKMLTIRAEENINYSQSISNAILYRLDEVRDLANQNVFLNAIAFSFNFEKKCKKSPNENYLILFSSFLFFRLGGFTVQTSRLLFD